MSFSIGPPPSTKNIEDLISIIWNKFYEIENEFYFMQVQRVYSAPARPQDGQLAYADGSSWNPGSGRGVYRWDSTSVGWVFLG